jgi:hypothetical protein
MTAAVVPHTVISTGDSAATLVGTALITSGTGYAATTAGNPQAASYPPPVSGTWLFSRGQLLDF